MTPGRIALVAIAAALAGCGTHSGSSTTEARTNAPAGRPYSLYTHCGIEWANIDGTFWRATQPLSDGSGNPPPGWGNPDQPGTLVLVNPTTATFTSPAGNVTFKRTSRTRPPLICS